MCRVALWQRTFLLKWPTEVVLLFFNCVNYFRHIIVIFSFFYRSCIPLFALFPVLVGIQSST